ncbi:GNAT family N-acetyltransferase [Paracraurococcus lichenis]|uniref:GNAT family N-acetyltransferase n=1 Tax=Paracraurococcus lichenis TaxID=3064888 RepID=A0ABT9E988_9PROT|nr:hypothetical protein [Paracraurococcus sp. LOR1-02]MDO9712766.1 hypothetical protein [Paracraurococcus sp. LOR1-02]
MAEALVIGVEDPLQAAVAALLAHSNVVAARLYPCGRRRPTTPEAVTAPDTRLLVARRDGVAVGLGVVIVRGNGTAELRRMIVD